MQFKQKLLCLIATSLALPALAQYVWLDENGVKQFSDMPPPKSIPNNRILKSPNKAAITGISDATSDSEPTKKTSSIADQNEEYNKRKAKQAEEDKKAQAAKQVADAKAANCEKARAYQRALDEGIRITQTDNSGNRNYMTDEQRASESAKNKAALEDCK
jgi:hypothetical protein